MKLIPGDRVQYYRYPNGTHYLREIVSATVVKLHASSVVIALDDGSKRRVHAENLVRARG